MPDVRHSFSVPRDELDERVQRAHVCRAAAASACALRSSESPPLREAQPLDGVLRLGERRVERRAVDASPIWRLYRAAVKRAERLAERAATIPKPTPSLPFRAVVSGVTDADSSVRLPRSVPRPGAAATCPSLGGVSRSTSLWLTGRDSATAPASRSAAAARPGELAVPAAALARRLHGAQLARRRAQHSATATSSAAASPPSHAASRPRARPASPPSARPARTRRPQE